MKNVLQPLAKSALIPLELTAAASATDAAIHKEMFGSGTMKLIISNEYMNDNMKIVRSFEESGLSINVLAKQLKTRRKNRRKISRNFVMHFRC